MRKPLRKVGFVVLGANGYMAFENALSSIRLVSRELSHEGIQVELAVLADRIFFDKKRDTWLGARTRVENRVRELGFPHLPPMLNDLASVLEYLSGPMDKLYDCIIVYDATPAALHAAHAMMILAGKFSNVYYFGEKPLAIDPVQLKSIESTDGKFFCDFIECTNTVVLTIRDFIARNALSISKMSFWRCGASGIKHLLGHNQHGVQGGALIDKGPHDLSIALMLLDGQAASNFRVENAVVHHLIPLKHGGEYRFLNKLNESTAVGPTSFATNDSSVIRRRTIADGLSSFDVDWIIQGGDVIKSSFVCGWLGYFGFKDAAKSAPVEKPFLDALHAAGAQSSDWLMQEDFVSPNQGRKCKESQARVMVVDTVAEDGEPIRIVGNMIMTDDTNQPIARWVKHSSGTRYFDIPVLSESIYYHEQKRRDLANIVKSVIFDCLDEREAVYINKRAAMMVHSAMVEAHDQCMDYAKKHFDQMDHDATLSHIASCIVP